jgi:Tfp pilus assembly protein PilO
MSFTFALLRRILQEHGRLSVGLLVALVLNLLAYLFVAYPLANRVTNITVREQTAETALVAAQQLYGEVSELMTGRTRAETELATFYGEVLPPDLTGARRLTHLRLAEMATAVGLQYVRATAEPITVTGSALTRLQIGLTLSGSYEGVRAFVYELDSADEFVVIDNVSLAQGANRTGTLVVTMALSTYYQNGGL